MIYKLEIENFYSIRERQAIDLTVGQKAPEEAGRLVKIHDGSKDRAPRVIAIYGPNASGKSNILKAITFLGWFVRSSFDYKPQAPLPYEKFLIKEKYFAPTKLSITFTGPEKPLTGTKETCPYVYSLELSGRNDGRDRVLHESLHYHPNGSTRLVRVFERDEVGTVKAAPWFASRSQLSVLKGVLRQNASVLATLGQLNNQHALNFIRGANNVEANILVNRFEQDDLELLKRYARNSELLTALNRDIGRIDLGVEQVQIFEKNDRLGVHFTHAGLDRPVEMFFESHGTQQFFKIYPIIHRTLAHGGVAVIDELDASIHPSILSEIVQWFADPERNRYGAQLWMNCHATSLLNKLLKEEILLCEKTRDGATQVYGLSDIKGIRREENFLQNYLGGVYGGVPNIG